MEVLPPGTILQLMHLKRRLKNIRPGFFLEVGAGNGYITHLLVSLGWKGVVFEISSDAFDILNYKFKKEINENNLKIYSENFLDFDVNILGNDTINLVISSMVMEHLNSKEEQIFLNKAKALLKDNGLLVGLVPAEDKFWGIEDDIAGHFRRYDRQYLKKIALQNNMNIKCVEGLTFPISNILLPISNYLVKKTENYKLSLPDIEKTKQSGIRNVFFKTSFPNFLKFILNDSFFYPFYLIQLLFKNSHHCMVLYFEIVSN